MEIPRSIRQFSIALCIVFAVILLAPGIPPHFEFSAFQITSPKQEYLDMLNSNSILDEAEVYYTSPHIGIESVVELENGAVIASDHSGSIFKITGKEMRVNITQMQYPCKACTIGPDAGKSVNNCGWPGGKRLDIDGHLIFIDVIGGLTKVNVDTGLITNLIRREEPIEGLMAHIPNDLDVSDDGTIYWTDACSICRDSTEWPLELIGEPSGRLIKFDRKTKTNSVLIKNLHLANGVCLSDDESIVLVAEMGSSRIQRYYLKGPKKGTSDIFVEGLPGYPDNIRSDGQGGYYVALYSIWNDEFSLPNHILSPVPLVRKFILRVRHILLNLVGYVTPTLPPQWKVYASALKEAIWQLTPILKLNRIPSNSVAVQLSPTGQVLQVLNGKSPGVPNLSQFTVGKEYAYLTGPFDNRLCRIPLSKLR